jgi:Txe/YoeB family toxin of Txe-Axe toxin-antitoxin module
MKKLRNVLKSLFVAGALTVSACSANTQDENLEQSNLPNIDNMLYDRNCWADVEYIAQNNNTLAGGITQFINELPTEMAQNDEQCVANSYRKLFVELFKKDKIAQKMGFNADCVERIIMPRIQELYYNNKIEEIGGAYSHECVVMVVVPNSREHIPDMQVFLHETAHVFNYREDISDLFAEVISGKPIQRPEYDWNYNTRQIRGVYIQMKNNGREKEFWENAANASGIEKMWNEFSPKHDGNLLMSFDEWQILRGVKSYKKDSFNALREPLEKISADFEKAYSVKDKNFLSKTRTDILQAVETAKSFGITNADSPAEYTPEFERGRHFTDKFYGDTEIHDALAGLKNLGFCNMDILQRVTDGIIAVYNDRETEKQFFAKETTLPLAR